MPVFLTGDFWLADPTDYTKQMNFDVSNLATGTLRTLKVPVFASSSLIVACKDQDSVFTANQTFGFGVDITGNSSFIPLVVELSTATQMASFKSATVEVFKIFADGAIPDGAAVGLRLANVADPTKQCRFDLSAIATMTQTTISIPNGTGTMALVGLPHNWTAGLQTYRDDTWKLVGSNDSSKTLVFEVDGASPNADLTLAWAGTADHAVTFPNATGTIAADTSVLCYDGDVVTYDDDLVTL